MNSDGPMRVAVITPYYREPLEMLRQCHDSVREQTHPCTHFLIADGHARPEVDDWTCEHFKLSRAHADNGNTPRMFGGVSAKNLGYDAVAYLDADNWFRADHVAAMVALHRASGAAVCTSSRSIHRFDGSLLYVDKHESNGREFCDTSCLFFTREAFRLLPLWGLMPRELAPACDRVMWASIRRRGLSCAHFAEPTVAFRTQYAVHYQNAGETPPAGVKSNEASTGTSAQWWQSLSPEERNEWNRRFDAV